MIKKQYRLKEIEVKRVLQKGKPFFSYGMVGNRMRNRFQHSRFSIVISSKSVHTNVERNFFRRKFYDLVTDKILIAPYYDFVFVIKKQKKLDKKNKKSIIEFENDIQFILKKSFENK